MKTSRFTEEPIVFALTQSVLGTSVRDISSDATFYFWRNLLS
ncbi:MULTISPECIES: transposase [Klebsiella]|nr:transposase [Klebsiella oxytoca]CAF2898739.1 hypothetical protein AI2945V1_4267 [Klebsiella oxytoca]CAF2914113.1 hypothetical protein AI2946V1_4266 [Klebsiella oxytoca]CAH5689499.1 hypothetical protein AI2946V1_4266 [Klebsiella oxytoca]CAH5726774.1 hypothetical protein AI2945V1_4267 [Klebsiella oxytoca]SQI86634.1 transposase IS3/IS911 family protein [Klebsiella oxytoca]